MAITATGNIALPLKLTGDLIAASAAFQGLVGVANAEDALGFIFEDEAKRDGDGPPHCVIGWAERLVRREGRASYFEIEGVIAALIRKEVTREAYEASYQDEGRSFKNMLGSLEEEMLTALVTSPSSYPDVMMIAGPEITLPDSAYDKGKFIYEGWFGISIAGVTG